MCVLSMHYLFHMQVVLHSLYNACSMELLTSCIMDVNTMWETESLMERIYFFEKCSFTNVALF